MQKLSFDKLGLIKKEETNKIQIGENTVEILKYLDIASKSSLINAAVRGSVISGVVDEVLLDAYLHLFILDHYTNIDLSPEQRVDFLNAFDILESNKFFDVIIAEMEPNEYEYIFTMAKKLMDNLNKYNQSMVSVLGNTDEIIQKFVGQTN